MPVSNVTSADLVTAICNGAKSAEAVLVQKYSRSICYILEKRCGNRALAEDLCQDTFIVLLQKLRRQKLDDPNKLTAYIHQIAINLLIAHNRKEGRRQTYADSEVVELYIASSDSPSVELEKTQVSEAVKEAILEVKNARDREILYRYYILEHDKSEICEHLDIDPRHYDKVISRARTRLKKMLVASSNQVLQEVAE